MNSVDGSAVKSLCELVKWKEEYRSSGTGDAGHSHSAAQQYAADHCLPDLSSVGWIDSSAESAAERQWVSA